MSTITTINATDTLANSRAVINTNLANLNADKAETLADLGVTASATEVNYTDGVTSPIQTQLDAKLTMPAGVIVPYAVSGSAPTGWLKCDGTAVSRTTYATLFVAISTTYGVGDGSTTFNLPDLRGRVVAGQDNLGGSSANRITDAQADAMGGVFGAATHTLTITEMPAHTHSTWVGDTSGATYTGPLGNVSDNQAISSGSAGGDGAHNNVQPTMFMSYIIKT